MVEDSLLISCKVPTYLISDLEMSEMRDLEHNVVSMTRDLGGYCG